MIERDDRAYILSTAGTVFLENGLERSSVDMVAAAGRISKQSIYALFPSKIELFEAAVRNSFDKFRLDIAIDQQDSVEATLARYAMRLFDSFTDPVSLGLFRANIAVVRSSPELATELHGRRLSAAQPLAEYFDTLLAGSTLRQCDPLAMAIRFGGIAVDGSRYLLGPPIPVRAKRLQIAAHAVGLFLHGYRGVSDIAIERDRAIPVQPPVLAGTAALRLSAVRLTAVVDAATREFLEQGYHRASVDRLAAAVRMSKATVYRHFGTKENLLRYVVQRDIFQIQQSVIDPVPAADDPDEALTALARQALNLHLTPDNIAMHRLLTEEAGLIPDLAQAFHDVRVRRLATALERVLAEASLPRAGYRSARTFYALATFALRFVTSATLPDAAQRDTHSSEAALLFLHGLCRK